LYQEVAETICPICSKNRFPAACTDIIAITERQTELISKAFSNKTAAIGRWGGEDFTVVIYGESEETIMSAAEKLRSSIEGEKFEVIGSITCSIGVSQLQTDDSPESWFVRADHALYNAKSQGRNRVCCE